MTVLLVETYPADVLSVGNARHDVERALEGAHLEPFRESARHVVDELVWNVVLHAESPAIIRLTETGAEVVLEVADTCADLPTPRHPQPDELAGRGLAIVEELTTAWGCRAVAGGKIVWATLRGLTDAEVDAGSWGSP